MKNYSIIFLLVLTIITPPSITIFKNLSLEQNSMKSDGAIKELKTIKKIKDYINLLMN